MNVFVLRGLEVDLVGGAGVACLLAGAREGEERIWACVLNWAYD